jgi:hypothetical protein
MRNATVWLRVSRQEGWTAFPSLPPGDPAARVGAYIRRQRHKVLGIQGIGKFLGSLNIQVKVANSLQGPIFPGPSPKSAITPSTRATIPF